MLVPLQLTHSAPSCWSVQHRIKASQQTAATHFLWLPEQCLAPTQSTGVLSYDTKAEPRQLLQYWPCAQGHSPLPSGAHKAAFLCSGSTEGHVHDYIEKSRVGTRSFLYSYLVQAATNKYHHELSSSSAMESSTPFALCIRWHLPDTAGLHQFLWLKISTSRRIHRTLNSWCF